MLGMLLLLLLPAMMQAQFTYTTNNGAITLAEYTGTGGAVVISNFVTSIGVEAFENSGLTSVTIPGNVITIGEQAFVECTGLTSVTIDNGVCSIGDDAFELCTNLSSVSIPGSVTNIGVSAFTYCYSLSSVTMANGVTGIGGAAFWNCFDLTSIMIPGSVTSIGEHAFVNSGLTSVYFLGNAPTADSSVFAYVDSSGNVTGYENATVYYWPGTSGWDSTFAGLPTVLQAASLPLQATASAVLVNDFVVGATITDGGCGYTNTPAVRIIGGGGSGAQAVAVMSNGVIIAVNLLDAGYGYTSTPLLVIDPPFIPNPVLGIAPLSFLTFSNLTVGGVYQLQQFAGWYWTNQPLSFAATNSIYTQMFAGEVGSGTYRLALNPVPTQAFAVPEVVNGFVVGATLTSGGSGYITSPTVSIVGGGGSNATAVSQISGGVVTNITITDAGRGYTNTPTVELGQPPTAVVSPTVQLVMRVDSGSLAPYDNYQIQFTPALGTPWGNWNGGLFSPTDVTNSQYLFVTNATGFFRLQYLP